MNKSMNPPSDFEEKLHKALEVPEPRPAYIDALRRQVQQTPVAPRRSAWLRPLRRSIILTAVAAAALFMAAGPQQVLSTARGWLNGYLPGFGYVNQSAGPRAIPAPIHLERDGATLTINQAFTDGQRTTIVLGEAFSPLPCENPQDLTGPQGAQVAEPYLMVGEERFDVQKTWASYLIFAPLPAEVNAATLYIPFQMLCNDGKPDWTIPLAFEALPAGAVLPALEPTTSMGAGSYSLVQIADGDAEPATLELKNVIKLQDDLLLSGLLSWTGDTVRYRIPYAEELSPDAVATLIDANGQSFPLESPSDEEAGALYADLPPKTFPWAFTLHGVTPVAPYSLRFEAVIITHDIPADQGSFTLNLGVNPQPGQVWQPNLTFQVADHTLLLTEVRALAGAKPALAFTFESDGDIYRIALADQESLIEGAVSGGELQEWMPGQVQTIFYNEALPSGERTFQIINIEEWIQGPWSITLNEE